MNMNSLEELRSALDYYEYISLSDEPFQTYRTISGATGASQTVNTRRVLLYKSFFGCRVIDLMEGEIERIKPVAGDEAYVITNYDSRITITMNTAKNEKIELPKHVYLNEHDLVNPGAWNKQMCFYDAIHDISAIGVDMFAFDYRNVTDVYDFKRKLIFRSERVPDYELQHNNAGDCLIPAFIIENNEIYLDLIGGISGRRRTYNRYKPTLTEAEQKQIHSFVDGMKDAYSILYEPVEKRKQSDD